MTTETGINTRKVWDALNKAVAGVSIQELCAQLALTFEEVVTAIRYLTHDHNIGLSQKDGVLMLVGE